MAEPIRVPPALPPEADFVREYDVAGDAASQTEHRDIRDAFENASESAREAIERTARKLRLKMRTLASERPMRLILGVAVISFVTGIGLRLWRSRYE